MTAAQSILNILINSSEPVSGETMAERIGVSRTAVWKGINVLRHQGFDIEARTGVGYIIRGLPDRILPDLLRSGLNTTIIGREVICYEITDSTNAQAKALAGAGGEEGTVIVAEEQTRGKGRLKRSWISSRGSNLLFSVILRPRCLPAKVFRLNMVASLSIVQALENLTPLKPLIKWPNDVYVGGKKLAGILTEFSGTADGLEYAVVGVGLNVNFLPGRWKEIAGIATSVQAELGRPFSRLELLQEILRRFDHHYIQMKKGKDKDLRESWNRLSLVVGKNVTITSFDTVEHGKAVSIDEDGALIVENDLGETKRVICGDVSIRLAREPHTKTNLL